MGRGRERGKSGYVGGIKETKGEHKVETVGQRMTHKKVHPRLSAVSSHAVSGQLPCLL